MECVLGNDRVVFPTVLPTWLNLAILLSFMEPVIGRSYAELVVHGMLNGRPLRNRLSQPENGFLIQAHFLASPFFLDVIHLSTPLHAPTLHLGAAFGSPGDLARTVVYVAGGHTLLTGRMFERFAVPGKEELKKGLLQRFPDLATVNFDVVKVHWSFTSMTPVADAATAYFVVGVFDEEGSESAVMLRLDFKPS